MDNGNLCEQCAYQAYDEDYDDYVCSVQMDEDDCYRLLESRYRQCPYYRAGDEYRIVRSQM